MSQAVRRVVAMVIKESLQIVRDPSALLIAFVFPPFLLFLFSYAVSLDVREVKIGLVMEGDGPWSRRLAAAYNATPYLVPTPARDRRELEPELAGGRLKAMVIIPQDFDAAMADPTRTARVQVISDGTLPNSAAFTVAYTRGVFSNWLAGEVGELAVPPVTLAPRVWFNPELDSHRVIVPGAMAIIMSIIGTLLTALVVSREWERGTMESMLSTPASVTEIVLSKLLPYFVLGLLTTLGCAFLATQVMGVPLRGSVWGLLAVSSAFLVPALGQGLLISATAPNQLLAAQTAVLTGFMPALVLSGFVFDIDSMPVLLQYITVIIPARYYLEGLQTVFLAGDVWHLLRESIAALLALGAVFFALTFRAFGRGLDR